MATKLWLLLAIPVILRLLKSKRLPSRETIIKPTEERVLLLGASSGVGRDLAHAYAKRGARMYVLLSQTHERCTEDTDAWSLVLRNFYRKSRENAWI
jgi:NADPH:quinone reductase-like Zn-dependent oxidoreductase